MDFEVSNGACDTEGAWGQHTLYSEAGTSDSHLSPLPLGFGELGFPLDLAGNHSSNRLECF